MTSSYSHGHRANRAFVFAQPLLFTGSASAENGVQVLPVVNQMATFKFNEVSVNAGVTCTGDTSYNSYSLEAIIYVSVTNQLLRSETIASAVCSLGLGVDSVQLDSTTVTFTNVPMIAFRTHTTMLKAFADAFKGSARSGAGEGGAKWGTIQVY
ncbi:hypothetical protein [Paenibacillus paeoniae]|uniref:hypothetical protein n=1 Tax=Paenibacillus paeoniae TaxID=2292705 RepID=UPI001058ED7D|nr:hypothetical protein [Paenibacillus paeoniae]